MLTSIFDRTLQRYTKYFASDILFIFIGNVLWKCVNLYCIKLRQKEQNPIMSKIIVNYLHIFLKVKKALCLDILSSYCLVSVTEAFFSDKKLLSVAKQILWQKLFWSHKLFPSSMTKICFSDENLNRNLFLWWKLVSWRKPVSVK